MARGSEAKIDVENRIKEAFGQDYVTTIDKKIYVIGHENGEDIQVCIALTCPKISVSKTSMVSEGGMDFENMPIGATAPSVFQPAQLTDEEIENTRKLIAELGL